MILVKIFKRKSMRLIYSILLFGLFIFGCKNTNKELSEEKEHWKVHYQMDIMEKELEEFDSLLIKYYNQSDTEPNPVIDETQKLIKKINLDPDPNNVRRNKLNSLYELRAEVFYKMGLFQNSINEILLGIKNDSLTIGINSLGSDDCIHLACNYVKLREYAKAKNFIDSLSKGYYLYNYILANFYEVQEKKEQALKVYTEIVKEKERDNYVYYSLAIQRLEELNKTKPKPKLLTELYYQTSRPDFEICKSDNVRIMKILSLIGSLPEYKACKNCQQISVYKKPREINSSCYWIISGYNDGNENNAELNFLVDTLTFEIKFLDINTHRQLTLNEWRKLK